MAFAETRDDLVYVDVVKAMLKDGRPDTVFGPDGLHMNRDGYALWARAVRGALESAIAPTASYCRD